MKFTYTILLSFSFFCRMTAYGADNITPDHYARFIHLTIQEELPDNHITCLLQDQERYIWIGTRNGLARFDGHVVKRYFHNPSDSTSIPNNYITDLKEDSLGNIWIGTKDGLACYNHESEIFIQTPLLHKTGKGISHPYVRAILPDTYPYLWIETVDGNLHLLNTENYNTNLFPHDRISQEYYDYHAVFKDSRGNIWIGGRNMGPIWLDAEKNSFRVIEPDPSDPLKKRDKDVADYFEDDKERFWVCATDGFYRFDRHNMVFKKFLATSTYQIVAGGSGQLWLGTGNGLYLYDVVNNTFIHFSHNENDPFSIADNHVNCVMVDADNNVWAGTEEGLSILLNDHRKVSHYRHIPGVTAGLSNNTVTAFFEYNDSTLYIGTDGGGLNKLNTNSEVFDVYTHHSANKKTISSNRVSTITGNEKELWIGLWQGVGFNHLDISTGKFSRYALDPNSFKRDWYNDLWLSDDNELWCGIWGSMGVHIFDIESREFKTTNFKPQYHPDNSPLFKHFSNGSNIIIGGGKGLLYKYNIDSGGFESFRPKQTVNPPSPLKIQTADLPLFTKLTDGYTEGEDIYLLSDGGLIFFEGNTNTFWKINDGIHYHSICKDVITGNYWLGSNRGLEMLHKDKQSVQVIEKADSPDTPLKGKTLLSLYALDKQNLLIGTDKGLLVYDHLLKRFEELSSDGEVSALNEHPVQSIKKVNDQLLFILNQGFILCNQDFSKQRYYNVSNSFKKGLYTDLILSVNINETDQVVYLGTDRGLLAWSLKDSTFNSFSKLDTYTVYDIRISNERLTLCTDKGFLEYGLKKDTVIFHNQPRKDMLSSHLVSFLHPDNQGNLWVGTTDRGVNRINLSTEHIDHFFKGNMKGYQGISASCMLQMESGEIYIGGDGLYRYDAFKKEFKSPSFVDTLPQKEVSALLEDEANRLWVISKNYISILDAETGMLRVLNNAFGLQNMEYTGAYLKTEKGEFLLGTKQGFIKFIPEKLKTEVPHRLVKITSVKVMDQPININHLQGKNLKLKYHDNFLHIGFSAMDFTFGDTQYEYKLSGIDRTWKETSQNHTSYTKIAPGHYTFNIRLEGAPENLVSSFNFLIKPPFWKSWWFIAIIAVLISLSILVYWRQRLMRIKVLEHNIALRQRLLLSQLNPHFIFNALIAIQNFIFRNEAKIAGAYLSKFAKLMRLYLNNMRAEYVCIEDEISTLTYYLDIQKLRFNNAFNYCITAENIAERDRNMLPTMVLQPLVENAIIHGLKDQHENGEIHIHFNLKDNFLLIEIKDNGVGYDGFNANTSNSKEDASLSTKIIEERIANFNKTKENGFYITFTNLTSNDKDERGTLVCLKLPIIQGELLM